MEKLTKTELWAKVHREKVECPGCGKTMSRRAIRWRHVCRGNSPKRLDAEEAEARQQKFAELTLKAYSDRMQGL